MRNKLSGLTWIHSLTLFTSSRSPTSTAPRECLGVGGAFCSPIPGRPPLKLVAGTRTCPANPRPVDIDSAGLFTPTTGEEDIEEGVAIYLEIRIWRRLMQ